MSSTVILTDKIRKIPYFSSFAPNEQSVDIPRPLINESIKVYFNPDDVDKTKLNKKYVSTLIENFVYMGLDTDYLMKGLLWWLGETKERMRKTKLSSVVQNEVNRCLNRENSEYIYGLRYRISFEGVCTCKKIAAFGNIKLLDWAKNVGCWISEDVVFTAHENNHFELRDWARRNAGRKLYCQYRWSSKKGIVVCGRGVTENGKYCCKHYIDSTIPKRIIAQSTTLPTGKRVTVLKNCPANFVIDIKSGVNGVYNPSGRSVRLVLTPHEMYLARKMCFGLSSTVIEENQKTIVKLL